MNSQELSNQTYLWPQLCQALVEKFSVLDAVSLHDYNNNICGLEQKLNQYRGYNFGNYERLVFAMHDTEYFYLDSKVGFTTYNLIELLYTLDISLSHCIFYTAHHGITAHVNQLCKKYKVSYPITLIENNFSTKQAQDVLAEYSEDSADNIQYSFCFLSNLVRDHRIYLRCYLHDRQLEDRTLLAWNGTPFDPINNAAEVQKSTISTATYITPIPFQSCAHKIIPNQMLNILYQHNLNCLPHSTRNALIPSTQGNSNHSAEFLKYSFLNIVAETVFDYPYPYLTEKSFKSFWYKRPFVIVGAVGSLQYLKKIGFKTFDSWFDESYDLVVDPADRMQAIFNLLDTVSKWSLDQCRDMYNQMKPVLKHNYLHYKNYFCQELLNQNIQQLTK